MAGKNQVTITFAEAGATQTASAFDKVGSSAKTMDDHVRTSGQGFDNFGEKIGDQERRWQGLRSSITGTQDTATGMAAIMKGDLLGGSVLVAGGLADLAQGFADTLVPLAKNIALTVSHKAAMVAHFTWSKLVRGATLAWAAAQRVLNLAFFASPLGLIVLGIAAIVAIVVIIATKTNWFQTIWRVAWGGIKAAAQAVASWFTNTVPGFFGRAWSTIASGIRTAVGWFRSIPGKIGGAIAGVASAIISPFVSAFNAIARAWNNTVGSISFTVPDWVPGLGGKGWSVPNIPTFHTGGVVPGAPGTEVLAILQAGETVTPAGRAGGTPIVIDLRGAEDEFKRFFRALLRKNPGLVVVNG